MKAQTNAVWIYLTFSVIAGILMLSIAKTQFTRSSEESLREKEISEFYSFASVVRQVCYGEVETYRNFTYTFTDDVAAVYAADKIEKPNAKLTWAVKNKMPSNGSYVCLQLNPINYEPPKCIKTDCKVLVTYFGSLPEERDIFTKVMKILGKRPTYTYYVNITKADEGEVRACACRDIEKECRMDNCISLPRCNDGTLYGMCAYDRPKICVNGELVDNCTVCGCDEGYLCQKDGTCKYGACDDECNEGEKTCKDEHTKKICGNYDSDPCTEWKEEICKDKMICEDGECKYKQCTTKDECDGGYCWGDKPDEYYCHEDKGNDGKYAPEKESCKNEWNQTSKQCYSEISGCNTDSPCINNWWPNHKGTPYLFNERNYACDIFEVCHPSIEEIAREALDCCKNGCGSKCHIYCQKARSDAGITSTPEADKDRIKKCAAFYIALGFGPAKKFMKDYYDPKIEDCACKGNPPHCAVPSPGCHCVYTQKGYVAVNPSFSCDKNGRYPGWSGSKCIGAVDTIGPLGWKSDDDMSENSCSTSDLPAHVDTAKVHTGVCMDYSIAMTTALRTVGYKSDEVYTVIGMFIKNETHQGGHAYNMIKLPGESKWFLMDAVGNAMPYRIGSTPGSVGWWDYCKASGYYYDKLKGIRIRLEDIQDLKDTYGCTNDERHMPFPPQNEVIGC